MHYAVAIATVVVSLAEGALYEASAAAPGCASPTFGLTRVAGTAGQFPFRIVSADFNRDGRADVATAGQDGAAVLLGNGLGDFGPATFFARLDALDVAAADLNGDGNPDLAVSWKRPGPLGGLVGSIDVRLGDGAGGFGPVVSFAAGAEPRAMVAVDYDANGTVDIVAADAAGHGVLFLSGNGAGGFAAPTKVPLGQAVNAITFGYFNGDAHVDFAVTTAHDSDFAANVLVPLLGDGAGGFVIMPPAPVDGPSGGLALSDVNGDGDVDVMLVFRDLSSLNRFHMAFYPGDGTGRFGRQGSGQIGHNATDVKAADLDGDGVGDIVARDFSPGSAGTGGVIHVLLPQPDDPPPGRASFPLPTSDLGGVALADFDGDGRIDIVTPGSTTGGNLIVMLNKCGDVADVSVGVARSPETPIAGEQITYTVTAGNAGPAPVGAYLEIVVESGADLLALDSEVACIRWGVEPGPFRGDSLRCDLGTLAPGAPGNDVTLTLRVVGQGKGGSVTVRAAVRTTVPDPNPVNNEVSNTTPTRVIGGRDVTVAAAPGGGTLVQWSGGDVQAGFLVRRLVDGVTTTFPEGGVPLSADTLTFTDTTPVTGSANCYAITPVNAEAAPLGRSGLACLVPGIASGSGPATASLKLEPSNRVSLEWAVVSGATGYVVWWQRTDTGETGTIRTWRRDYNDDVSSPRCYAIAAYQDTTQLGYTDLLCAVPDVSTLPP